MKSISKIIVFSICILCFTASSSSSLKAKRNDDLIRYIVEEMDAEVKETGLKASVNIFDSKGGKAIVLPREKGEKICTEILKSLFPQGEEIREANVLTDGDSYTIEFMKNNINGYIESRIYDNHNIITLDIKNFSMEKDVLSLKAYITKVFADVISKYGTLNTSDIEFKYYLTAKLQDENLNKYYSLLIGILDEYDVSNLNTIKIEKGCSITANSRHYDRIKSGGKWIDINIALSKYLSGNYITIGTPAIYALY